MHRIFVLVCALIATLVVAQRSTIAQRATTLHIQPVTVAELRTWDTYVTQHERAGDLRVASVERDPALPTRTIERLQQLHHGIPVWGATVVRDSERGVTQSIFGELSADPSLSAAPGLGGDEARVRFLATSDVRILSQPTLVVLPLDSGGHVLSYMAVTRSDAGVDRVFIDAHTGAEIRRYSELRAQAAVGTGTGVLNDTKKLSVRSEAGAFFADDQHRPPVLVTFDARGSISRADAILSGASLTASDRAVDGDNAWTDPAVVDAHVHVGWTYDYYFKRFGRRGLDNRDRPIYILTNAIRQEDAPGYPLSVLDEWSLNAFWCPACGPNDIGMMFFGNGIPSGFVDPDTGKRLTYFAGGLDVAAHELTHAVTSASSDLIYQGESGALDEAFSDVMGTSVEFFFQPTGTGKGTEDYLIGEDIDLAVRTGTLDGTRSLANPGIFGDPDHYSRRLITSADNGGVHTNSGIVNHAFYLAIEGGVNRTSGLSVQGVGGSNREQIENVFYRAFVFLLPSNARFSTARAATLQAARDLYGPGSAVERAVTQAWTAVGVF